MVDVEGSGPTIRCILFPICSEIFTIALAQHVHTKRIFVNATICMSMKLNSNSIALKMLLWELDKDMKAFVPTSSR